MSFGLAFAKGLVGGFTKNIEREIEARGADDQRLANLEDFLFQKHAEVSAKGKGSVPKALGEMLKDAKSKMDKRGRIDLIGSPGDRLSLDIGELNTALSEADDDLKYWDFGAYKILQPDGFNHRSTTSRRRGEMFMSAMNNWVGADTKRATVLNTFLQDEKNSNYRNRFWSLYNRSHFDIRNGALSNVQDKDLITSGKWNAPDLKTQYINLHNIFGDLIKQETIKEDNEKNSVANDMNAISGSINNVESKSKNKEKSSEPVVEYNWDKEQSVLLYNQDKSSAIFKFHNKQNWLSLLSLAKMNGETADAKGATLFIKKYRNQIGRGFDKGRMPQLEIIGGGIDVDDTTGVDAPEQFRYTDVRNAYPSLFHAINLRTLGGDIDISEMKILEATKVLNYVDENFTIEKTVTTSDGEIVKSKFFDKGEAMRALAPLMVLDDQDNFDVKEMPGAEKPDFKYIKSKILDKYIGTTLPDFNKKYLALTNTKTRLKKLMDLVAKNVTSSGIGEGLLKFLTDFGGKTGTIEQIADGIFNKGSIHKKTNKESLQKVIRKLQGEGLFEGFFDSKLAEASRISQMQSLAIILAADMARAVDPSGRLSNQDFEVQLRRLGESKLFSSRAGRMAALNQVKSDFDKAFNRIEMVNDILVDAEGSFFSPRQVKLLMANNKLNVLYDKAQALDTGDEKGSSVLNKNETFEENNKTYPRYFDHPTKKTPDGRPFMIDRKNLKTFNNPIHPDKFGTGV